MDHAEYTMNLGDFLKHFEGLSPETEVIFGAGNLEFFRTKWRGENLLQIEFSQQTWPAPIEKDNIEFESRRRQVALKRT